MDFIPLFIFWQYHDKTHIEFSRITYEWVNDMAIKFVLTNKYILVSIRWHPDDNFFTVYTASSHQSTISTLVYLHRQASSSDENQLKVPIKVNFKGEKTWLNQSCWYRYRWCYGRKPNSYFVLSPNASSDFDPMKVRPNTQWFCQFSSYDPIFCSLRPTTQFFSDELLAVLVLCIAFSHKTVPTRH